MASIGRAPRAKDAKVNASVRERPEGIESEADNDTAEWGQASALSRAYSKDTRLRRLVSLFLDD